MGFSLPQLFVLPSSNNPATYAGVNWGSTVTPLAASQFGVYKPDYTAATAANVASQAYIQLVQARPSTLPGVDHKRTDKIYLKNVIEWYKVTGSATGDNQITEVSAFNVGYEEDVTITIRLRSFYSDVGYYNGLTKSFTIKTPCGNCGDSPCETLAAGYVEDLVEDFVDLINKTNVYGRNPNFYNGQNLSATAEANDISSFVTASATIDGVDSVLTITGKTLASEPTTADRTNFPYQYDRVYFWTFAYKGPALSQDYITPDSCDTFATVERTQPATYPIGTAAQIKQLEIDYNSYNTAPIAKQIFKNINFNQGVQATEVQSNKTYDMYYLKYKNPTKDTNWNPIISQDESAIICNPTGENATTIAILTAFLGTPVDKSI